MDKQKSILFVLSSLFFLFNSALLISHSQLLPILDRQGGNSSQIQVYIVHVEHPDGTGLLSVEERDTWYKSFLPNATLDSGEPRLVYTYHNVINGFAAKLTMDELKDIEAMDGFVYAHVEKLHSLHTTYTPEFLGLNQWNSLWEQSNQGEGIIIGVLDSGITPGHPSFKDDGMPPPPVKWRGRCELSGNQCNKKLIGAKSYGRARTPVDETGHGTHTAGTAAGNFVYDADVLGQAKGTAAGMAPKAHIAAYRVCDAKGCPDSAILKGFDEAVDDGVDVLSLSFGLVSEPLYSGAVFPGTFGAMEKGIFTSCSAGNSGPDKSVIANDAPWIMTVGASTTDRRIKATVKLGNGMEFDGESAYQPDTATWNMTMLPLVYPGVKGTQETLSCQNGSLSGFDVKGKIVLCGTGHNDRTEKAEIVKAAGGAAVIVMSQPSQGFRTNADPYVIPAVSIGFADAWKLLDYFKTDKNPTATIIFKATQFGFRPTPEVASFSSRGPSLVNGGILKPDIVAPGANILAAWPLEVGPDPVGSTKTFNFVSGTSMAAPHISGVAALLKRTHPEWSPAMIKSAMMTTAYTLDRDGKPFMAQEGETRHQANVFAFGAGHVNPTAANDPGLVYDTKPDDYIPYLCGLRFSEREITAIVRKRVSCIGMKRMRPEQLNYPSIAVSLRLSTKIITVNRTVRNVGEPNSVYSVKVDEPKGTKVVITPNTLQFSSLNEEQSFTVEISFNGASPENNPVLEGQLSWVSDKHVVRSPIVAIT